MGYFADAMRVCAWTLVNPQKVSLLIYSTERGGPARLGWCAMSFLFGGALGAVAFGAEHIAYAFFLALAGGLPRKKWTSNYAASDCTRA